MKSAPTTTANPGFSTAPSERAALIFFWLLALTLAGIATWANLDLTEQRAFLFMDEMIPFDNVKRILTAPSPEALGAAVFDGGDHRYGRISYNVSALTSWLPHRLAGDKGLIIALRSTQVALLVGAMVIFCLGLIRTWGARLLALLALACLPYTDYYLTMPKPEPVQLFCYAWFMLLAVRRKFAFGWHWIFLGLAFGAKISAAPLCACAGMLAVAHCWLYSVGWKQVFSSGAKAVIGFVAGWVIAIPMLAVPSRVHLDAYLNWTFRATGHGSDDSKITILDWAKSFLGGEVVRWHIPQWVMVALLATTGLFLLLALICLWRRRIAVRDLLETHSGWLVLGLAASLLLPIMMAVKRLWGFYLFPGQMLAVVALAGIAERWLSSHDSSQIRRGTSRVAVGALVGCALLASIHSGKGALREYTRLAHRTSDALFLRHREIYQSALETLTTLAREANGQNGGTFDVLYDPFLFLPESQPPLSIQVFWEAPRIWDHSPAAIVLGREWHLSYFLHEKPLPPSTAAIFPVLQAAVEKFTVHVEPDPAAVSDKPYQLVRWFGEDAALILRKDQVERWRRLPVVKSNSPR